MNDGKGAAPVKPQVEVLEREVAADTGMLEALNRSEIDVQIATGRRFPRSITGFKAESVSLASLDEHTAEECIYALPRDDKTIEGPSARFAEIIAYSWGNCRAGARVVDETGDFVTAQGMFWDLQKNTAIAYEVKRRIVNKNGKRFSADMIGVTANAACSIALRNAVLKGIPKALWSEAYEAARKTIMGDFQTLAARRQVVLGNFMKFGVTAPRVYEKLGIKGEDDITLDHIVVLRGMLTALKEGDSSPEDLFPMAQPKGAGEALKQHMDETAGQQQSTTTSSAEAKPEAGAKGKPQARGTPAQKKKHLDRMASAADMDVLSTMYADTQVADWSPAEREELDKAFQTRKQVLEAK